MTKTLRKDLLDVSRKLKVLSRKTDKIISLIEKIEKSDVKVKTKKKVALQMIQPPIKLEMNKINQIKRSYSDAVKSVGYDDQEYVYDSIDNIIEKFLNAKTQWKSQLGHCSKFLVVIYKNYFEYFGPECPGWLNLNDVFCLECGEDERAYENYQKCKQRKKDGLSLEENILTKKILMRLDPQY